MRTVYMFILPYLILAAITHLSINAPKECDNALQGQQLDSMLVHSDRFHQNCVILKGEVIESGDPFFDLLWIRSYTLKCGSKTITIFSNHNTPVVGSYILLKGEFRQFFHGHYFTLIGIVESERMYLDHHET